VKTSLAKPERSLLIGSIIGVLFLATLHLCPAPLCLESECLGQSVPEPSVVISFAPLNKQLTDIEYIGKTAGGPIAGASGMLRVQVTGFLAGVDMEKPIGAHLYFDEKEGPTPKAIVFIPVVDYDALIDKIADLTEVEEDGEFTKIIPPNGQELTVRKSGDFAFVSESKEMLQNLPSNPGESIAEAGGKYNFAAKVFAQRIPASLREQALQFIRQGYESGIEELEQSDPLQAQLQRANFDLQMAQVESIFNETDELMIGYCTDEPTERLFIDVVMKVKPGSQSHKRFAANRSAGATQFGGFLMDKAALNANFCTGVTPQDAESYAKTVDQMLSQIQEMLKEHESDTQKVDALSKLASEFADVFKSTVAEGKLDGGIVMFTQDGLNGAAGLRISDPKRLERAIKDAAEKSGVSPSDEVQLSFNAGTHQGVALHEAKIRIPDDEDKAKAIFGDHVTVIVGVGNKEIYVAAGKDPSRTLTDAIDKSKTSAKPQDQQQLSLFLAPILEFAASIEGNPMVEDMADKLKEVGKDRLRVVSNFDDTQMRMQIEVQDGLLQLMGVVAGSMNPFGGGGPPNGGADF
jgi:hypothetical protein